MGRQKADANSAGVRTNFDFQFIATPTSDTPGTSMLLRFDDRRYIIGEITEGTQRACIQRAVGLKKVRALFLSGKTHWNNGGLIGMILSLADVQRSELDDGGLKRPKLDIYAGPMQLHSLACARRFVFRTGMPLSVHEVDVRKNSTDLELIHEDENIRAWALSTQEHSPPGDKPQGANDQTLRKDVVHNMFDSDWKRDQLFTSKLKDIKLPALVYVRDPETKELVSYPVLDINNSPLKPDTEVLHRNPWPAATVESLPLLKGLPRGVAMSYIIKGHPQRGTFDPGKAKALGLKSGPNYGKLVNGESVTSDDGHNVITPEMVLGPVRPGKGLALFDIPSVGHLEDLGRQLNDRADAILEGVEVVVWATRGKVLEAPMLQKLMQQLGNLQHVVSDASLCNDHLTHDSSALSVGRLALIAPALFTIPRFDNSRPYHNIIDKSSPKTRTFLENAPFLPAKRGLKIHVEPSVAIDDSEVAANLDASSFAKELEPAVREVLPEDTLLQLDSGSIFLSNAALDEPEIITLGTGSAAPSKYRNVSAVLLRMPNGQGNYLFDCGEGTLGQLKRLYDSEQLADILSNLRAVWISHLHADHHLGTMSVLKIVHETAQKLADSGRPRPRPPYLLSEINMIDYVDEYQSVLGLDTDALCVPISCNPSAGLFQRRGSFDMQRSDPYISDWRTVKVSHCHGAQAVSVTFKSGFKFSYSGDCRPSDHFCHIGAGSDVLVHEATFEDGMDGDAYAKKHSTTGEAVGVALAMGAKNLILTHFSQRYQKMPVFSSVKMPQRVSEEDLLDDADAEMTDGAGAVTPEDLHKPAPSQSSSSWAESDAAQGLPIAVAFDLMRIKVSQIKHMKTVYPAISKMFEVEEAKAQKARREVAEQDEAASVQKKLAKDAAKVKNKERFENRKKKQRGQKPEDSKRAKRKFDDQAVNGAEQTPSIQTMAPAPQKDEAAMKGSTQPLSVHGSAMGTPTKNDVEVGRAHAPIISTNATSASPNNDRNTRIEEAGEDPSLILAQQEPIGSTQVEESEAKSPMKRRRTG